MFLGVVGWGIWLPRIFDFFVNLKIWNYAENIRPISEKFAGKVQNANLHQLRKFSTDINYDWEPTLFLIFEKLIKLAQHLLHQFQ